MECAKVRATLAHETITTSDAMRKEQMMITTTFELLA
jgi:hypothetical protein